MLWRRRGMAGSVRAQGASCVQGSSAGGRPVGTVTAGERTLPLKWVHTGLSQEPPWGRPGLGFPSREARPLSLA